MYRSLDTEIIKNRAAYIERIEKFLEIRREVGWRLWLGFDFIVCFRTCAVRTISKRSRNREKKFRYFLCAVHPRINKDRLFLDLRKLVPLRNFLQKPFLENRYNNFNDPRLKKIERKEGRFKGKIFTRKSEGTRRRNPRIACWLSWGSPVGKQVNFRGDFRWPWRLTKEERKANSLLIHCGV